MANINQVSPDGGTTIYDLEDTTARNGINAITDGQSIESFSDVETALETKANTADLGTAATKNSTSVVTQSTDLVESGAVKDIVGWGTNKNLFDEKYPNITTTLTYRAIYVGDGDFTMSSDDSNGSSTFAYLFFLAGNVSSGASSSVNGVWNGQSRTVTSVDGYVTVAYRAGSNIGETPVNSNTQIEKGDTVTTYEPYHASVEEYCASKQDVKDIVGWGKNLCIYNEIVNNVVIASCKKGVTYTFSLTSTGHGGLTLKKNDNLGTQVAKINPMLEGRNSVSFTADSDFGLFINGYGYGGYTFVGDASDLQVEIGSTATEYEPHHASVADSLEDKADNSVIGTVEGVNASKAWSVGEHFINDGQFKKVTQPISSGGAINSSNTEDRPIADCLIKQATFSGTTNANGNIILSADNNINILSCELLSGGAAILYKSGAQHDSWSAHIVDPTSLEKMSDTAINGVYYYINK